MRASETNIYDVHFVNDYIFPEYISKIKNLTNEKSLPFFSEPENIYLSGESFKI